MFDVNEFKRKIKTWVTNHPDGNENDLIDYCEDLIPPAHSAANQWLVEQTVGWFRHLKAGKK